MKTDFYLLVWYEGCRGRTVASSFWRNMIFSEDKRPNLSPVKVTSSPTMAQLFGRPKYWMVHDWDSRRLLIHICAMSETGRFMT